MKPLKEIKNKKRFVIRTIRNGKVKIFGYWFKPREEYNGELDGQRWAFGIYRSGNLMLGIVYLWGTEELYNSIDDLDQYTALYKSLPNLKNGFFHWSWWDVIEQEIE